MLLHIPLCCVTACIICMYLTVVCLLEASREVPKASGDSGHVTMASGIGLVQM